MTTRAIDSHVHFWKVSENDWYPALAPFAEAVGSATINTDFLPGDYRRDAVGLEVQGFVHVNATTAPGTFLAEMAWIDALADSEDVDLVMVGTIDPESAADQIRSDLDAQAAYSRFVGVRVFPGIAPDSAAAELLLGWLESHGKIFDLVTDPRSAQAWADKLAKYPDLRVALEHTGSPDPSDFAAWQEGLRALAARPGLMCKLTGLGMATMSLQEETLRPWMEETLTVFGADRVMFGSNVPIETMAGTYAEWIGTVAAVLAGSSATEREQFYASNARRLYWA